MAGTVQAWANSRGTKMSVFFAHWCNRMALSQPFRVGVRSLNVCTGTIPARFKAPLSEAWGFATIGDSQTFSSSVSGLALPM